MRELTAEILKKELEKGFEKQALMIKRGFDETASKTEIKSVESRLTGVEGEMLKVHDRLTTVGHKLDSVLYKEFDRIETRLKRVEQKLGINPAA